MVQGVGKGPWRGGQFTDGPCRVSVTRPTGEDVAGNVGSAGCEGVSNEMIKARDPEPSATRSRPPRWSEDDLCQLVAAGGLTAGT